MTNDAAIALWTSMVPSGKWRVRKPFVGTWRLTKIQGFDSKYIDLCGPAKMKISTRGTGRMNFGAVNVEIDCKMDELDERLLQFSFEGSDEGDPICGRGYCHIENTELIGRFFRHYGDEFGFKATLYNEKKK